MGLPSNPPYRCCLLTWCGQREFCLIQGRNEPTQVASFLRAGSHGEPGLDGFPCCCPVLPDLGLQTSSPSFHLSDSLMIVPSAIFRVYNCAYEEGMGKLGLHHLFWTRSLTHVLYIELPYLPVWIPYYQFILFYQCVSCILFLTVNAINICY